MLNCSVSRRNCCVSRQSNCGGSSPQPNLLSSWFHLVLALGTIEGGGVHAIRMESSNPPIADHEMTEAEVKMCLADPVCNGTLSAFTTALREQRQTATAPAAPSWREKPWPEDPPPMPPLAVSPSKDQATIMPWQRNNLFSGTPTFKLGEPQDGIHPLMVQAYLGDYEMTAADVRMCLANAVCGPHLRAYIPWRGVSPQQIGVRNDPTAVASTPNTTPSPTGPPAASPAAPLRLPFEDGERAYKLGDYATAYRVWTASAAEGNPNAQNALGVMYLNGQSVTKDDVEAVRWFRLAAEQGHPKAQTNLGSSYANGRGVLRDDAQAFEWFRLAADQGTASAQNNLGRMYGNGRGVVKDESQAAMWYQRSAAQGNPFGQVNLGNVYSSGRGATKDPTLSYMWYTLAIKGLSGEFRERAVKGREKVSAELTSEQIVSGEQMAQNWKPKVAPQASR